MKCAIAVSQILMIQFHQSVWLIGLATCGEGGGEAVKRSLVARSGMGVGVTRSASNGCD